MCNFTFYSLYEVESGKVCSADLCPYVCISYCSKPRLASYPGLPMFREGLVDLVM